MKFYFKAKKVSGEEINGERDSGDKFALARELRAEGLILLTAKSAEELKRKRWWQFELSSGVKIKDKIVFAGNLSSMITAGLSLSRALGVMERQTANKRFREVIHDLLEKINSGTSLSQALEAHQDIFPPVFTAMVGAGEESGKLPEALKIVSEQLSKTYELRRKIKGAMIYPTIIISLVSVLGVTMMIYLVPILTKTFKGLGVELPTSTRLLIFSGQLLADYIAFFVGGLVVLIVGLVLWYRSASGQKAFDYLYLRLPVVSLMTKETNSAVMMRTISSLITAGVSMVDSLKITERVLQNYYYKQVLRRALDEVQKGIALSETVRKSGDLFPPLVVEMVEVGEETGNLPQMMLRGATFYEEEIDQATKNLSSVVEPLIMIVIGLAVGFFAVSLIGPMYSLSDAIKVN